MLWLIRHIPHLLPLLLAFGTLVKFGQWALDQPPPHLGDAEASAWRARRHERADAARVRRSVARRGLMALGPLVGALATGLVVYSINLGGGRPGAGAIWLHVAISTLAILLIAYKLMDVGLARLREGLDPHRALEAGASLFLAAVLVPLLVTGVVLLVEPSKSSFTAYFHLVASAWWTVLLQWHLWRYFVRAAREVLTPDAGEPAAAR